MNKNNTYPRSKANPITRLANSFPPVTLGFADREQLEEQRISSEYEKFRTSPAAKITEPTIDDFDPKKEATVKPVNLDIDETTKPEDSPFVTNLKAGQTLDNTWFSMDRANAMYNEEQAQLTQQNKTLKKGTIIPTTTSSSTTKNGEQSYGVLQYFKDAWRANQNGKDETDISSKNGEIISEILPKLNAAQTQLEYATIAKQYDDQINGVIANKIAQKGVANWDSEIARLTKEKSLALGSISIRDKASAQYVKDLVTWDKYIQDPSGVIGQLKADIGNRTAQYNDKLTEIKQLQDDINDRPKVSEYYLNKEKNAGFGYTKADAWLYGMPRTLGSSMQTWKQQGANMLYNFGASLAQKSLMEDLALSVSAATGGSGLYAKAAVVGLSTVGLGLNLETQALSRHLETDAELYTNYKDRIKKDAAARGIDTNKLINDAKSKLKDYVDTDSNISKKPEITDDEAMDFLLTTNLKSGDAKFDALKDDGRKGLQSLRNVNYGLSASDIAESIAFVPFLGTVLGNSYKALRTTEKLGKGIARTEQAVEAAKGIAKALPTEVASKILNSTIVNGAKKAVESIAEKTILKVPKLTELAGKVAEKVVGADGKTYAKYVKGIATRGLFGMASEGGEEGTQQEKGYKYQNGLYDDKTIGFFDTVSDVVGGMFNGAKTAFGLSVNPALDNDQDYQQSVVAGAMMGGLFSAVGGVQPTIELKNQIQTNHVIQNYTVDQLKAKENLTKASLWADKALKGKGEQVMNTLDMMKANLPEGLTTDDVDNIKKQAEYTMNYANSPVAKKLAKEAGITYGSQDYKTMVGLALDSYDQLKNEVDASKAIDTKLTSTRTFGSGALKANLDNISKYTGIASNTLLQLNNLNQHQQVLTSLIDELKNRKEVIDEMNADEDFAMSLNSDKIDEYIERLSERLIDVTNSRTSFVSGLASQMKVDKNTLELGKSQKPYTEEELTEVLNSLSTVSGYKQNEVSDLIKMQELSNLSLEDANNRYNAYNGLFFNDKYATKGVSFDKATKDMSKIERRNFAASAIAKDEINHYISNNNKDRVDMSSYVDEISKEANARGTIESLQAISQPTAASEVQNIVASVQPLTHIEEATAEEDTQKQQVAHLDGLKTQIDEVGNTLTTLKNNPENTIKYLPKELRKEVSKNGFVKTVNKYERQLDDLQTEYNKGVTKAPTLDPTEVDPKRLEIVEKIKKAYNDVSSAYEDRTNELNTLAVKNGGTITDEQALEVINSYRTRINEATYRHQDALKELNNPEYTSTKEPTRVERPSHIAELSNEEVQPSLPVEEIVPVEEEQQPQIEIKASEQDEFMSTLDKMVAESPEFRTLPVNKQRNEINRMRRRALKENPERVDEIKAYFDDLISKSIVSTQVTPEPLKTPENASQGSSTVSNVIASDYLLTGGIGSILSSDYLLKGISGTFTRATNEIDDIRKKYLKEITDSNLGNAKDFATSELYKKISKEIKDAIDSKYNNDQKVQGLLDEILQNPTGLPNKVGTRIEKELDAIHTEKTIEKPKVEEQKVATVKKSLNQILAENSAEGKVSVESGEVTHTEEQPADVTPEPIVTEKETVEVEPTPVITPEIEKKQAQWVIDQAMNLLVDAEQTTEQLNAKILSNEVAPNQIEGTPGSIMDIMLNYDPTNDKPMTIEGYPNLKSGKELAKVLDKPNALEELDTEIVVRDWKKNGSFNPTKESTYDNAGVYIIFTDKSGNQYATALRTTKWVKDNIASEGVSNRLNELRTKIIRLSEQIKDQPNAILKPTRVSRNNGLFDNVTDNNGAPVYRPIHEVKGFDIPKDFKEIDKGTVTLGIGRGVRYGNTIMDMFGDPLPGTGASGKIYIYPKVTNVPDGKSMVNIQLREKPFKSSAQSREIASLIYDALITKYNNNDFAMQIMHNGQLIDTPFTPYILGRFLVNNSEKTLLKAEGLAEQYPFLAAKQLFVDTKNGKVYYGKEVHTLADMQNDPQLKEDFIQYIINNQHWAMDKEWLFNGMRDNLLGSKVTATSYFNKTGSEKLSFIPGELEFDKSDFGLISDQYETKEDPNDKGLSWIAWYTKNGKLVSDLSDDLFRSPINYIEDVKIAQKTKTNSPEVADDHLLELLHNEFEDWEPTPEDVTPKVKEIPNVSVEEERPKSLNSILAAFGDKAEVSTDDVVIPDSESVHTTDQNADMDDMLGGLGVGAWKPFVRATNRKINTAKAVKWLNHKLGLDPNEVKITSTLIHANKAGMKVVGGMTTDSILLWEGAEKGVEYHEAFHRVSLLLFNDYERKNLYDYYRSKNKAYKMSDKEVDENLADEFMDFNLNPFTKHGYEIVRGFKKMLQFLHIIKDATPNQAYEVFRAINSGKFAGIAYNPKSVARFQQIYGDMATYSFNGKTFKNIPTLTDYYNIVESLQALLFSSNHVETIQDVDNIDTNRLYNALVKESNSEVRSEAQRETLKEVVERFESDFLPDVKKSLKQFAIRVIDRKSAEETEKAENEGTNVPFADKASYEVDKVDNAQMSVKMFIAATPKVKFEYSTKDGVLQKRLVAASEPLSGLPLIDDYKTAFHTVLERLHNCDTWDKILKETERLGKDDPFFQNLYLRLSNPKIVSENLQTQFLTTVNSNKHNMIYLSYAYNTSPVDDRTLQVSFRVGDSNIQRTSRQYANQWSNTFYNGDLLIATENGIVANADKLESICKEYNQLSSDYSKEFDANKINDIDVINAKKELINILSKLGVNIDLEVLNDYLAQNNKLGTMDKAKELRHLLTSSYAGSLSYLFSWNDTKTRNNRTGLLQAVANGEVLKYKEGGIEKVKRLNEIFKGEATINKFADSNARVHPRLDSMSVMGADGNMLYPISQNCYATDQTRWLNDNNDGIVDKMLNVTYNKHSVLLQHLKNGNKIALNTFVNFVEDSAGDRGRDYLSISDTEDFLSKMTLVSNDYLVYPTMADKKMYFTISGYKLNHQPIRFINRVDGRGKYVQFNQGVVDTFYGYMIDELNTIDQFYSKESQDELRLHPEKITENYHTAEKGGRLRYFNRLYKENIDGTRTMIDLNKDIMEDKSMTIEQRIARVKEELLGKPDANGRYNQMHAEQVVNNMLAMRYMDDLNKAVELGLIEKTANNMYQNKLLDQVKLAEYMEKYSNDPITSAFPESYAVRAMLADYSVGSVISIMEFEKLFTKDPAYYKNTDTKIKRVTAVLSTGDAIRTQWAPGNPANNETKFNVTEFKDNEIISNQIDQLKDEFTHANLRDLLMEGSKYNGKLITEDNVDEFLKLSETERKENLKEYPLLKAKASALANDGLNAYGPGRINQTDATVIIGPAMYQKIVKGLGEWSPDVAKAFEIMEGDGNFLSDAALYQASLKTLIKPLKTMYFGDHFDSKLGLDVPVFDKMAMFPLFKVLAKGDSRVLYDRMNKENDTIDMVAFSSAVKVGTKQASSFYTDPTNTAINDLSGVQVYKQDYKYLRRQLVTDPHHSERQLFGTQASKAALSNLRMDRTYGEGDKRYTGAQIRSEVMGTINALSNKGLTRFLDSITVVNEDGTRTKDNVLLSKMLIREAESGGMTNDVIEGLQLVNGEFKTPLSALSDAKWIESRFISLLNKEAVDIQLPGGAFIQRSSFGFKQITTLADGTLDRGKYLNFRNSDGSMDTEISINLLSHVIPNYDKMSFDEAREYLIKNNIIGENATPCAMGYRIPTQGQSSIVSLRIKDVLPSIVGDMIILPDEFTALTGSDFDIDKLYVARYNYEKYEDGIRKVEFNDNVEKGKNKFDENSREANENRLLDMYMTVLNDKSNVHETKASLDAPTEKLKSGALKAVRAAITSKNESPFYELSPSYQLNKKHEYTGGKAGIAPFALNNVHHVLTQLFNVNFALNKKGNFKGALNKYDFGTLSEIHGKDGFRILDWLSAMINAHVDVAKDPYIIELNVTQPTYNMTNFLLRGGLGEGTFYFLPQPILKEYVTEMEKLNGRYGIDKTKSNFTLRRDAVLALKNKYIENAKVLAEGNDANLKLLEDLTSVDENTGLNTAGNSRIFTIDFLEDQLMAFKNKTNNFDYFYNQLLVLNAFQELTPFAEELSELVHISQIDTKKFGNSFALQQRFLYRVKNMLSTTGAFNKEDLMRLFENSFLDTKLRNSVIAGNELAKDMLITSTDAFNQEMESIMSKTNHSKTKDETFIKNVSNGIEAFVRSKFFAEYSANNATNPYMDTYNLFYNNPAAGTLSMANRFAKIKTDMINGKYPEFVDKEGRIVDDFINYLSSQPKTENDLWNIPDVIGRNVPIGTDKYLQDKLTSYWNELINNKQYPELSQFAKDLVYYSFITSGGNTKLNSIFHLVPSDYLSEIGYHNSIRQSLEDLTNNSFEIDTDDIFKNNWWNGNLVPDITLDKGNSHVARINSAMDIPGTHIKYPIVLFNHKANPIGINSEGKTLFKPYIKANLDRSKNPSTTLLYKYIGNYEYTSNFGGTTEVSVKPVYVLVNKKGLSQEGVFIVEHDGYSNSAFGFNNIPDAVNFHTSDPTSGFMLDGSDAANTALLNATNLRTSEKAKARDILNKIEYIKNFNVEDDAYTKTYDDIMQGDNNVLSQEERLDITRSVLPADDEAESDVITQAITTELSLTEEDSKSIDRIFKKHPILNTLFNGDKMLYHSYLESIFPNANEEFKGKLFFHGTPKPIEGGKFKISERSLGHGLWFTKQLWYAKIAQNRGKQDDSITYGVVLGIENPKHFYDESGALLVQTPRDFEKQFDKTIYDAAVFNHPRQDRQQLKEYNQVVIFDENKVHIIGDANDINLAKSFLNQELVQVPITEAEGNGIANVPKGNAGWARFSDNSYEVSTAGDSRFSALNARLKDGRTIEEAYQLDVKGYRDLNYTWQQAKGDHGKNAPIKLNEDQLYNAYKGLWEQWANENPELIQELYDKTTNKTLTDKFATGNVTQARALSEILNSRVETETTKLLNNTEDTNNDPINFNDENTSIEILNSDNGILTNDEVKLLRKASTKEQMTSEFNKGFKSNFKIAVASEHTDPVFFANQLIAMLDGKRDIKVKYGNAPKASDIKALYIITKHDGLPIKSLIEYDIPKIIHFSITTLGGTKYEPGVMKADDLLDRIETFIGQGLDPSGITLRIDPIIPFVTRMENVEHIVERASKMGIKKVRFSVMDYYSTTAKFMQDLGYDYNKAYNKDATGKYYMHAKREILNVIMTKMANLKYKYGVTLSTCAEPIVTKDVSKEACLSVNAVNQLLGTSISDEMIGKQRKLCSCFGGKTDLLQYDNTCLSTCAYCYAHHNATKPFDYYDSEGKLKNNIFTKTSKEVEQKITKPKDLPTIEPFNDIDKPLIKNETKDFIDTMQGTQQNLAKRWSDKEGWSIDYFNKNVLPKLDKAWQIEYKVAENQNLVSNLKGSMKYFYGNDKNASVTADTTLQAIINGERTATTRYETDGHIDYWKNAKTGDIIEFSDGRGNSIKVEVTVPLHKLLESNSIQTVFKFDENILATPIVTDNGIKTSSNNPNIINVNGRQLDIAEYGIPFKLNSDQINALTRIDDWYNNSETISHTLIGAAGTGKTSITKVIVNSIASQHPNADIVLASFTHSAVKNLAKLTGREAITIHSMLGLSLNYDLDNFKLSDLNFERVNEGHKFKENGIIVIDECSMVNESLVEALREVAKDENNKILFIGDDKQLMPVGENRISLSFRDEPGNISKLTKVERQQGSNPLLKQLDAARASQEDPSKLGVSFNTDYDSYGNGVVTIPNKNPYMTDLLDTMVGLLKSEEAKTNPYIMRGLAFRNETVDAINRGVRIRMGYESKLEVDEPVKFYSGSSKFTNSAEARVSKVSEDIEADLFSICGFKSANYPDGFLIKYNKVEVSDFDDPSYKESFYMISDESYKNDLAKIYKDYHDLTVRTASANPMYRGRIWREYYKNTGAIVTPFDLKVGKELVKKVVFKPAYASTVHKSQGSTYTNVMVHQEDINTASDPMLRKQLTYVAMSRPTKAAFVVTNSDLFHENAINEYNEEMNKANDEFDSDAMTKCKA